MSLIFEIDEQLARKNKKNALSAAVTVQCPYWTMENLSSTKVRRDMLQGKNESLKTIYGSLNKTEPKNQKNRISKSNS
ncbi:hypothetical protein [Methanosarcina barkeri]|uniref:hypothetical protein n=1 Tax=Methanosarcina barkeri TaxID=2208 RepID=UPI000ABB0259|nr:hypothetical protein [Methanosarcina barkeri]